MLPCGVSAPLAVQMNTFLYVTLPLCSPSLFSMHPAGMVCFSTTATVHITVCDRMKTWKFLQIIYSNLQEYLIQKCTRWQDNFPLWMTGVIYSRMSKLLTSKKNVLWIFFKPGTKRNWSNDCKSIRIQSMNCVDHFNDAFIVPSPNPLSLHGIEQLRHSAKPLLLSSGGVIRYYIQDIDEH